MLSVTAIAELVYQDESGSTGALTVRTRATHTVAEIDAGLSGLASIVASMTGCVLVRQRIKYTNLLIPSSPAAIGSSVKRRGVFFGFTSDTTPEALVEIPGIISDVFVTVGPCADYCIDLTNADIVAFTDELLAVGATNPFGDVITLFDAAYLQSRV